MVIWVAFLNFINFVILSDDFIYQQLFIKVNDIAVLKLATPVTFTKEISPVCLYTKTPVGGIGLKGTVTGKNTKPLFPINCFILFSFDLIFIISLGWVNEFFFQIFKF